MCNKYKKEHYKKVFCRVNNPILKKASKIVDNLVGSKEEKLGQLEMIVRSEDFKERHPGFEAQDLATIARSMIV